MPPSTVDRLRLLISVYDNAARLADCQPQQAGGEEPELAAAWLRERYTHRRDELGHVLDTIVSARRGVEYLEKATNNAAGDRVTIERLAGKIVITEAWRRNKRSALHFAKEYRRARSEYARGVAARQLAFLEAFERHEGNGTEWFAKRYQHWYDALERERGAVDVVARYLVASAAGLDEKTLDKGPRKARTLKPAK